MHTYSSFRVVFQVFGVPPGSCSTTKYGCATEYKEAADMLAEEARRVGWDWVIISEKTETTY